MNTSAEQSQELRKYEAIVIFDTKGKDETIEEMANEVAKDMTDNGASSVRHEAIGRKRLAYPNKKMEFGQYISYHFEAPADFIKKIQAILQLNNNVYLKYFQKIA